MMSPPWDESSRLNLSDESVRVVIHTRNYITPEHVCNGGLFSAESDSRARRFEKPYRRREDTREADGFRLRHNSHNKTHSLSSPPPSDPGETSLTNLGTRRVRHRPFRYNLPTHLGADMPHQRLVIPVVAAFFALITWLVWRGSFDSLKSSLVVPLGTFIGVFVLGQIAAGVLQGITEASKKSKP